MSPELKIHKETCKPYKDWLENVKKDCGEKGKLGYQKIVDRGEIEEWKNKIRVSTKKWIAETPGESERRREVAKKSLNIWAKSEEGRRISSETATKTSARPEIQKARTKNLKKWRDENPEKFFAIVKKLTTSFRSHPEICLFKIIVNMGYDVKHSQQIFNELFSNKSKRRQVDIKGEWFVIEFDGPRHFGELSKFQNDQEYNSIISSMGYTVIRISYDQFSYRRGGTFTEECLKHLKNVIDNRKPGLYLIGDLYAKD